MCYNWNREVRKPLSDSASCMGIVCTEEDKNPCVKISSLPHFLLFKPLMTQAERKAPVLCLPVTRKETSLNCVCLCVAKGGLVLPSLPSKLLLIGLNSVLQPGSRQAINCCQKARLHATTKTPACFCMYRAIVIIMENK